MSILYSVLLASAAQFTTTEKPRDPVLDRAIQRAIDRVEVDPAPTDLIGAKERYLCRAKTEDASTAEWKIGIFRTHIKSAADELSVLQDNEDGIVGASAQWGQKDIYGGTIKWAQVVVIDRKTLDFRQEIMAMGLDQRFTRRGSCIRY